jgi:hypothetical protein
MDLLLLGLGLLLLGITRSALHWVRWTGRRAEARRTQAVLRPLRDGRPGG